MLTPLRRRRRPLAPPAHPPSGLPYVYEISDESNPFEIRRLLIGCALAVTEGAPEAGAVVKICDRYYRVRVDRAPDAGC